jgi:tetratricopeptide (TPR) repeat protein
VRTLLPAVLLYLSPSLLGPADAQMVKGEVTAVVENGFARLVFTLAEEVQSQVQAANGVLIITFQRPVQVAVDKLALGAPGYVGMARRDPDAKGIRIALTRKAKVSSVAVAEQLFVDLLPETWSGLPPGLPREVVEELSRRALQADKKVRQQQALLLQTKMKSIRVRVASQPTFMRYVFDLPEPTRVVAHDEMDKLSLTFAAPFKFDLADAKATLPSSIEAIDSETSVETTKVRFSFAGKVDVRTFREESSFVVDVTPTESRSRLGEAPPSSDPLSVLAADLAETMKAPQALPVPIQSARPLAADVETQRRAPAQNIRRGAATRTAASMPPPAGSDERQTEPAQATSSPETFERGANAEKPSSAPAQNIPHGGAMRTAAPLPRPAGSDGRQVEPAQPPSSPETSERGADAQMPRSAPAQNIPPGAATRTAAPLLRPAGSDERQVAAEPAQPPSSPETSERGADPQMPRSVPLQNVPRGAVMRNAARLPRSAGSDGRQVEPAPSASSPEISQRGADAEPAAPPPSTASNEPATPSWSPVVATARNGEPDSAAPIHVATKRIGDSLSMLLPFGRATPAAIFSRADALWLVFDTDAAIALGQLDRDPSGTIKSASVTRGDDFAVVRIKLERPRLVSAKTDGTHWVVTVGAAATDPTQPLGVRRQVVGSARSGLSLSLDEPRHLHRIKDPDAGDELLVVTALGPAQGFVNGLDFVEFRVLASTHGVVLQPISDDLAAELAPDRVLVSRPKGLTLSAVRDEGAPAKSGQPYRPHVFNTQTWGFDRHTEFRERSMELLRAAAEASEAKRQFARVELARFYLARDMAVEAKAVLDVVLMGRPPLPEDSSTLVLRAVAQIMMGRLDSAVKDLNHPFIASQHDAALWRAVAHSRQGKWGEAGEGFRTLGVSLGTLPLELRRMTLKEMVLASIESGDVTGATSRVREFEAMGVPRELEAPLAVLNGRLAEALGHIDDALRAYQAAADSWDRPAAAQGRLRELVLQHRIGKLQRIPAVAALETLTTVWRGDETEIEALHLLSQLYTEEGRHRDAFHVMRTALAAHPGSDMTRRIQDEAAENFDSLFLSGKGDALPPIDALALFYDFRDLTPIGRRGDEMIRRLADRLVTVDLLDQAAELLQHQVEHRLEGAARAQVAARLAGVYLLNYKPDRALATLRTTRTAAVANDLRQQRLLLEARALSDLGRHDVAIEVVASLPGPEAPRLHADILWAGKRWREAAEQIERMFGERWRDFSPFTAGERRDVLRAAIGYALGEDSLGLARFRERYAAKMSEGPDGRAFDVVTVPIGGEGSELRDIVRSIAATDTLDLFLRDLRARLFTGAAISLGPGSQNNAPPTRTAEPATTGTVTPRTAARDAPR